MKISRRTKRMARHHKRSRMPGLNLVSLMDIFTILVFFLLVTASDVQNLPNAKSVRLPTSTAQNTPENTLIITVTKQQVLVQGRAIIDIQDAMKEQGPYIDSLEKELLFQASRAILKDAQGTPKKVTILGDKHIPYSLLRKIMATCAKTNYTSIALAVNRQSPGKG